MVVGDAIDAESTDPPPRSYTLAPEYELRFEVPPDVTTATLTLQGGAAELFGIELALNKPYTLPPSLNAAAFTWHGATLVLQCPTAVVSYIATDTPMPAYISAHAVLQSKRQLAKAAGVPGPRAVVVGPRDCGKSTFVSMLASYCVKANGSALVVDVDPSGCGAAGIVPGSIALSAINHLDLEAGGLMHESVVSLMLGHTSPRHNPFVSEKVFEGMGSVLDGVLSLPRMNPYVGCLVDTSGDIDGKHGSESVIQVVKAMKADVVFVLGAERLYATIQSSFEKGTTETVLLPKSGGVVSRDDASRMASRSAQIKRYFYGIDSQLSPFSTAIEFGDAVILKVGGMAPVVPDSVLPIGAESTLDPLKPVVMTSLGDVLHKILGVSQAETEDQVLTSAVHGFVHVVKVDTERNTMTVLAPSPGKIPGKFLLAGDTKWIE